MSEMLRVYNLGKLGVNVDKSPIHLQDGELTKAQNAIREPLGVEGGLKNRPGLRTFNANPANGTVLGGIGVPLADLTTGGKHFIYLGRGPGS